MASTKNTNDGEQFDDYFECLENCEYGESHDSNCSMLTDSDFYEAPDAEMEKKAEEDMCHQGSRWEENTQLDSDVYTCGLELQKTNRNVSAAIIEDATRRAAYDAARNQGANIAGAQAMTGQTENATKGNATAIGSALRSGASSSQNDYLQKMGYANGLNREAENLRKGAFLNNLSAIFGGAGQGASAGASLGSSLGGN